MFFSSKMLAKLATKEAVLSGHSRRLVPGFTKGGDRHGLIV